MIDIELWGGPVDGQVISVDSLRPVWHVPMAANRNIDPLVRWNDDLMFLADDVFLPTATAVYERATLSTSLPQRYLYRGIFTE